MRNNVAAGFLAHEMGFPIKLIATVNSNDILARSFQNGDYSPSPTVAASLAPAMDIQVCRQTYYNQKLNFIIFFFLRRLTILNGCYTLQLMEIVKWCEKSWKILKEAAR